MARRVWPWILNSIIAGWLIYGLAYWDGVLALNSRGTEHLAPINLLILATDKFVPMVNLGSSSGWRIDTTRVGGSILQLFEIAYRALGWFFTGLAAAALAGLLRKE